MSEITDRVGISEYNISEKCAIVLYYFSKNIVLKGGILSFDEGKVKDLVPLISDQYEKDSKTKLSASTLGKYLNELINKNQISFREIGGLKGFALGKLNIFYKDVTKKYEEQDKIDHSSRIEFINLFSHKSNGNYIYGDYGQDGEKFVTIFPSKFEKRCWSWVYDDEFSDRNFAEPFNAYIDLRDKGIMEKAKNQHVFDSNMKFEKKETELLSYEEFEDFLQDKYLQEENKEYKYITWDQITKNGIQKLSKEELEKRKKMQEESDLKEKRLVDREGHLNCIHCGSNFTHIMSVDVVKNRLEEQNGEINVSPTQSQYRNDIELSNIDKCCGGADYSVRIGVYCEQCDGPYYDPDIDVQPSHTPSPGFYIEFHHHEGMTKFLAE